MVSKARSVENKETFCIMKILNSLKECTFFVSSDFSLSSSISIFPKFFSYDGLLWFFFGSCGVTRVSNSNGTSTWVNCSRLHILHIPTSSSYYFFELYIYMSSPNSNPIYDKQIFTDHYNYKHQSRNYRQCNIHKSKRFTTSHGLLLTSSNKKIEGVECGILGL